MKAEKLVFLLYAGITVLSVLCVIVTTATMKDIFFGLLYMWLCYGIFRIVVSRRRVVRIRGLINDGEYKNLRIKNAILISLICAVAVVFSIRFYTGNTPTTVLNSLRTGQSLYQSYQNYFASNQLGIMQLQKIPAIIANILVEFVFIYSYINYGVLKNSRTKDILIVVVSTVAKIYFGIARGTNFEMFEIAFLAVYCFWVKRGSKTQYVKRIALMFIGIVICVFLFDFVVSLRGMQGNFVRISQEIYTDNNSIVVQNAPVFSKLIARVGAYFSFGTFVTSYYFDSFFLANISNFVSGIIPLGNVINSAILPSTETTLHLKSVCWTPDMYLIIRRLGIIGGPLFYAIMGNIYNRLEIMSENYDDIFVEMLKYFLIYELFSLPIGNFVWISSASRMVLIILIVLLICRGKIKGKYLTSINKKYDYHVLSNNP